ncbi:phosphomannomutase [Pseudoxanthomonas kalamensis DSM 18571]|nr:phosphomannomutase [Pseudoxanthomonas kalamensis DSM 18571]
MVGGLPIDTVRRLLPYLAALCGVLMLWFGLSGVQQWREERQADQLRQVRDQVMQAAEQAVTAQTSTLAARLAEAPVQAALAAGDADAVAALLKQGWDGAQEAELLSTDLHSSYVDAAGFGYAKLALLETVKRDGKPVARMISEDGQPALGVAAVAGDRLVLMKLAPSVVTDALDRAPVPGGTYVGLRQGGYTLTQKGNTSLSGGAESLARPVGDSSLRVVAGLPDGTDGPLGLGAMPCLIVAGLCGVLAVLLLLLWKGRLRMPARASAGVPAGAPTDNEPTLGQTLQDNPLPKQERNISSEDDTSTKLNYAEQTDIAVDPEIFRAYDIRGIVGQSLSPQVAKLIGQAIGTLMREQDLPDIVVGRDGRLSGPEMAAGLIEGLRKAGCNVIDIGLAPTPVAYFAAYHLRAGSCVAVTGSHNPPDYNGFKIVVGGQTLSGEAITDLYARISEKRLHSADLPGGLEQRDVGADYIQRIADDVQMDRPLKVVVDAGNGVAGELGPQLLEAIGAEVVPLYCEVDGTFPNHHPDPSEPHNLEDLVQMVQRFDADLGLAFDGDGDRLGVVTPAGSVIFPDRLLMLFAADVLERNPGALILYDVKCTGKLQGWVLRHGGTPMMWQTGHSLIKAKMRETGAELAGEMSGHFFFQERWYGFDDGLYSAARLLEILSRRGEAPGEVLQALPDGVSTPEIKVPVKGSPHQVVERFVEAASFEGARLTTIDGLRADWDDGWGLLRASNTTPVLVLRFEADSEDVLERIKTQFRELLAQVAPELKPTF